MIDLRNSLAFYCFIKQNFIDFVPNLGPLFKSLMYLVSLVFISCYLWFFLFIFLNFQFMWWRPRWFRIFIYRGTSFNYFSFLLCLFCLNRWLTILFFLRNWFWFSYIFSFSWHLPLLLTFFASYFYLLWIFFLMRNCICNLICLYRWYTKFDLDIFYSSVTIILRNSPTINDY